MIQTQIKKRKVVYKNGKRTRINSHLEPVKNVDLLKEYIFKAGTHGWDNHLECNMFKIKLASNKYYITNDADVIKLTSVNRNLFETILLEKRPSRFVLDIDAKNIGDSKFSYNDLIKYIDDIKNYMRTTYELPNINLSANIHVSHPLTINNNLNDAVFNSAHIIFNFAIERMNIYAPDLLNDFFKDYNNINGIEHPFKKYTDYKIYKSVGWFRCLNQTKASNINLKLKKVISCPLTHKVIETKNIDKSDFIQVGVDKKYIIKINASKHTTIQNNYNDVRTSITKYDYNIVFEMPANLEIILNKIKKSKLDIYGTSKWWALQYNILYCLYTNEIKDIIDILNNPLIILFLKASMVGVYDSIEHYNNNIQIIKDSVNNFKIDTSYLYDDIVALPTNELVLWMEHIMGYKIKTLRLVNIKTIKYFIIDNNYCFNINYKELMFHYYKSYMAHGEPKCTLYDNMSTVDIVNDIDKSSRSIFAKLRCESGTNYNIKLINKVNADNIIFKKKRINNLIENNNIEAISKLINYKKHNYVWASVGTGKSKCILEQYIKEFLNDTTTPNKKLIIIADTISITHKQKQDVLNILKELNIPKKELHYYKEKAKKADDYNFNNKSIFITTYDSFEKYIEYKFTHFVLDEIKNINKRFVTIQNGNKTNQQKIELLYNFINMLREAQSSIILDADLDIELYDFLNSIRTDINYYKLTNIIKPHKVTIFNQEEVINKIYDDVRLHNKIIIATASDTLGRDLECDLNRRFKDIKILYINKNGAFINTITDDFNTKNKIAMKRKELILANVDIEFIKYDVVFYTPTVQTGLSFNIPNYFHRTYGLLNINTIDTTQTCQFLNRCRNTMTNDIFLSMNNFGIHTVNYNDFDNFDDSHVFNHIKNLSNNTRENIITEFYDQHEIYNEAKDIYNKLLIWNNSKSQIRNRKYVFHVCVRLIEWGFVDINISITSCSMIVLPNDNNNNSKQLLSQKELKAQCLKQQAELKLLEMKSVNYSQYDNYVKSTHLNQDTYNSLSVKYKDKTSEDQDCQDVIKTQQNNKWGYNEQYYNQHKVEIDSRYTINIATKFEWDNQCKMSYLPLSKSVDIIINNIKMTGTYDDFKKNTRVEVKKMFSLVVNLFFIDKLFECLGIGFNDLYKLCFDITDSSIFTVEKNNEWLNKLYIIIDKHQNIINILLKINKIKLSDKASPHQRLSTIMVAVCNYFNIKCKFGKQMSNPHKKDRNIQFRMPYARVQIDRNINIDNGFWNGGLLIDDTNNKFKKCMYSREIELPTEREVNCINHISAELNQPNITRQVENKNNDYLRVTNQCLIDFTDF